MSRAILLLAALCSAAPAAQPPERPQALAGALADVQRFERASNVERFDALTALLRDRGVPFEVERFTIEKGGAEPRTEGRNVVVTLGAGEPGILVGAHYDAARLKDGSLSRGAVDNAASAVVLVRLAETLRRQPPSARVRIVFFDMEELGLLGSAAYLKRHGTAQLDAVVNLDINAYGDTVLYGPSTGAANAALRRTLIETCAAEGFDCVGFPQFPPSDDRTFIAAGVPTVSLAMLPAVEAHQAWLLLNGGRETGLADGWVPAVLRTIHTATDTSDKVSEETMGRVYRFALALTRQLAK